MVDKGTFRDHLVPSPTWSGTRSLCKTWMSPSPEKIVDRLNVYQIDCDCAGRMERAGSLLCVAAQLWHNCSSRSVFVSPLCQPAQVPLAARDTLWACRGAWWHWDLNNWWPWCRHQNASALSSKLMLNCKIQHFTSQYFNPVYKTLYFQDKWVFSLFSLSLTSSLCRQLEVSGLYLVSYTGLTVLV